MEQKSVSSQDNKTPPSITETHEEHSHVPDNPGSSASASMTMEQQEDSNNIVSTWRYNDCLLFLYFF